MTLSIQYGMGSIVNALFWPIFFICLPLLGCIGVVLSSKGERAHRLQAVEEACVLAHVGRVAVPRLNTAFGHFGTLCKPQFTVVHACRLSCPALPCNNRLLSLSQPRQKPLCRQPQDERYLRSYRGLSFGAIGTVAGTGTPS